jgi:hypothetical protein
MITGEDIAAVWADVKLTLEETGAPTVAALKAVEG